MVVIKEHCQVVDRKNKLKHFKLFHLLSKYLKKYQEESTKVSMVSVSLEAGPPQLGQEVSTQLWTEASGDFSP